MGKNAFVDIHAHLDDEKFAINRISILEEFFRDDASRLITIADPYSERSIVTTLELLEHFPMMKFMIGAHPHQASQYSSEVEKRIIARLDHPGIVGIGEAGLDYHYNLSPPEKQVEVFSRQISIAAEARLPLLLHSRKAEKEILKILSIRSTGNPIIFHCYTGGLPDGQEIVQRGYYLSFSGIITFKKADELRVILAQIPVERIFLETDSPYLAPEPHRGETNSPLFISQVYLRAAEVRKIGLDEMQTAIFLNYKNVFDTNRSK